MKKLSKKQKIIIAACCLLLFAYCLLDLEKMNQSISGKHSGNLKHETDYYKQLADEANNKDQNKQKQGRITAGCYKEPDGSCIGQ